MTKSLDSSEKKKRWDYRYELIAYQRHPNGIVSYTTRAQGSIPYTEPFESARILLDTWATARTLAEKTLKDVVVYVIGKKILPRVRTTNSFSFLPTNVLLQIKNQKP